MKNLQRLWGYSKKYWRTLVISMVAASVYGVVAAMPTWILKHTVDDIFIKKHAYLIVPFLGLFLLFFVLKGIFMYLTAYTMHWVGNKVVNDIRSDLFSRIVYFPLSFFGKTTTGQLLSHFLNDIQMIQNASSSAIKNGIRSFFEAFFLITFAFVQNWKLSLLLLLVGPAMAVTIDKMGKMIKKASFAIQTDMGLLSSMLQEVFVGIREIKAFNAEEIEKTRFNRKLHDCFVAIMTNVKADSLLPVLIEVIAMLGGSVVFYIATQQVLSGSITAGQMTSFIAAVLLAYQPLKRLVSSYSEIQYGLAASERIFAVMDNEYASTKHQNIALPAFSKDVVIKNVSFSYDGKKKIFDNVSLEIKKGESIGIVGPSGGGKSTLCDLLLGFVEPDQGDISIDGVSLATASRVSLHERIGYVGQRTFLFNDSIKNNVAYATKNVSLENIQAACKAAHAEEFIAKIPEAYEAQVGENGGRLSGGQKQRLTIARALLKDPDILLFDEVTSALDQESEGMIQLALQELSERKKTLIVVSHRPALLQYVDKVILVQDGMLRDVTHEQSRGHALGMHA